MATELGECTGLVSHNGRCTQKVRMMGHNSKAVHRAYAKHVEVIMPSLYDREKEWRERPDCNAEPKSPAIDSPSPLLPAHNHN